MAFDKRAWSRANYRKLRNSGCCVTCGKQSNGLCRCVSCQNRIPKPLIEKSREYSRNYRKRFPEIVRARSREWYKRNQGKKREYARRRLAGNPERFRKFNRDYYAKNRQKMIALSKLYQSRNKPQKLDRRRELRKQNKDRENLRQSLWRKNHREIVRDYGRKARAKRMERDLSFAIRERLRTRIRQAIKSDSGVKSKRTMELLGCSISEFKIYIESKFESGMHWNNWGHASDKWNLDHIIPCALFDFTKEDHQKRCFHFSNYQPLWQPENLRKSHRHYRGQLSLL